MDTNLESTNNRSLNLFRNIFTLFTFSFSVLSNIFKKLRSHFLVSTLHTCVWEINTFPEGTTKLVILGNRDSNLSIKFSIYVIFKYLEKIKQLKKFQKTIL